MIWRDKLPDSAPIKFGVVSIREVARAFKSNKALLTTCMA